ncbi:hypothetical protein P872_11810 [Rhodonellum psychrophilum GCM71 = DSM 17998]|uniref:Glycosyltransferase 2-like domain-containing protein n=2 Tax=Rhodonellum TaxID=336827 RepID=U5BWK4_9BACT|nr:MULTISPECIES: glycosyltransferase family A protein [Rhodonellum]ERM80986.1 hypothetical protein P872_11810 [Rhodonellum psychrophilum GCM71 = DSM 17998]SDZ55261.1 Glycosyltransferase involved in cell wall bisynthesis [Rhodonellum ikkaensis]
MDPEFSIIIPSYNRASTIGRAIDSVIGQTYTSWEIIVVDDGSTDNTREIILSFPHLRTFVQKNLGVSVARNNGASLALGNWLIFLDSDDELLEESLELFFNSIQADSSVDVWVSGFELVKNHKIQLKIPEIGKYHPRLAGAFSIRKTLFYQTEGYDAKLKFSENTELFHRINLIQAKEGFIPKATVKYFDNLNGGSKDLQNIIDSISYILEKHDDTLSTHVKFLYHQIIGVILMRLKIYNNARSHLYAALKIKPYKFSTLIRLGISWIPILSKKIYKEEINL